MDYLQDAWRTLPADAFYNETIPGYYADLSDSLSVWNPERVEQRFDFSKAPEDLRSLMGKYTHSYIDPTTKRLALMGLQQPGEHKYDVFSAYYNLDPNTGQYVLDTADEQRMKSTFSKLVKTIGPVLGAGAAAGLAGMAGAGAGAGAGTAGSTAGSAGGSLLGGALPEIGAGLGTAAADITGSSLLTGGVAGAGTAGLGSIGLPAGLTLGGTGAGLPTLATEAAGHGAWLGEGVSSGVPAWDAAAKAAGAGAGAGASSGIPWSRIGDIIAKNPTLVIPLINAVGKFLNKDESASPVATGPGPQADFTKNAPTPYSRAVAAAPAGYRHGFEPEHKFFTGIGGVGS